MIFWVVGFVGAVLMTYGPLFLDHAGAGGWLIGLYFTLSALAAFVGQNFWGPLFDRFRNPGLFIRASLAADALLIAGFLILRDPYYLIAAFTLILLLGDAYYPAIQATVTFWFPEEPGRKLGELYAFKSIGWCTSSFAGMIIFASRDISSITVLFSMGLVFILVLLLFSLMHFEDTRISGPVSEKASPLSGQIRLLSNLQGLRWFAMLLLWVCMANALFFSYFGVFFKNSIGGTESGLGVSMMMATVLGAISYPIYGRLGDRKSGYFLLNYGMIMYLINFILIILLKNPLAVIIIYAFPVYSSLRISGAIFISNNTDQSQRGTGLGLIESLHALGMVIGPVISGLLVAVFGLGHLPHIAACFISVYIPLYLWMRSSEKEGITVAAEPVEG